MEHKDILLDHDEEKERAYEQIQARYRQGKSVKAREHDSGFPAVTVDCEDIHILTDIISLERWWAKKKEQERSGQLNKPDTAERDISEIVGVFTDPIVVFPGGWGDTLPDWLKGAVTLERLEMNMKALKGEGMTGTDAEACAYLYTAALTQPLDHDWTPIYLYVASRAHGRWNKGEMPEGIRVESLTADQMTELNRLKEWLYRRRTQAREERDRAERRERKEEETARREAEQPVLFEF